VPLFNKRVKGAHMIEMPVGKDDRSRRLFSKKFMRHMLDPGSGPSQPCVDQCPRARLLILNKIIVYKKVFSSPYARGNREQMGGVGFERFEVHSTGIKTFYLHLR